ncbi:exonuclease (plasmid) [Cereibacter azotoformans]|uniref:exonuclease n=1 Tax=Cereibacter azotoformans TaxID=43057 RepID=UPI003B21C66C
MTSVDAPLLTARHEVEHLFGQCILRLQAFELLLKLIVAGHHVSGSPATFQNTRASRIAEVRRKTLGGLVGEMMGSVLVPAGQEGEHDACDDDADFACSVRIAFPVGEFARIEAEHRELVALRNALVHHFLEEQDLRTEAGCLSARQALMTTLDRVTRAHADLQTWAAEMEQARRVMAEYVESPEFHDWIVHGQVPWHVTTIAQALVDAASELAPGGWTSVEAAVNWVLARRPGERPEMCGCRSWRQVIHESGLFDLQVREVDGRRQAWYRPRIRKADQPRCPVRHH